LVAGHFGCGVLRDFLDRAGASEGLPAAGGVSEISAPEPILD
jgi:hypothetical protein